MDATDVLVFFRKFAKPGTPMGLLASNWTDPNIVDEMPIANRYAHHPIKNIIPSGLSPLFKIILKYSSIMSIEI